MSFVTKPRYVFQIHTKQPIQRISSHERAEYLKRLDLITQLNHEIPRNLRHPLPITDVLPINGPATKDIHKSN